MTTTDHPEAAQRPLATRVLAGGIGVLALAAFTVIVLLGLTGHLGQSLYGIRLHSAPSNAAEAWPGVWALAVGASVGITLGPLRWPNGIRPLPHLAPVVLIAASLAGAVAAPNSATWAALFLPAAVTSICYLGFRLWWRVTEPLRRGVAWPLRQLSASVALAAGYTVVTLLVALSYRTP